MGRPKKIVRAFDTDLEVRSGSQRIIEGIAVPFGERTEIRDLGFSYTEEFVRGAFTRTITDRAGRIPLLALHKRDEWPIGAAIELREDQAGLFGRWRVSKTPEGDAALELVADGALSNLSIGFRPIRSEPKRPTPGELLRRLEVRLDEISLITSGMSAYPGARVLAMRDDQRRYTPAEARLRLLDL